MLRIDCPFCGERDRMEFVYGGDAAAPWAGSPQTGDLAARELYRRGNPAGPHAEYWQHAQGCRRWLRVVRDTRTHAVLAVDGQWPRPEVPR